MENLRETQELPQYIRDGVTIRGVSTVADVLDHALLNLNLAADEGRTVV
jgi:ATP-dependent Lon protease